ncbi:hypothetical protein [Flavobacterium sp.]|uniref:hypothetical protein n=1 Tax=Flavobacterium sp. TaxID=239 RepID=UPI004048A59C
MQRVKFIELGFKKNLDTLIVCLGILCLVIGLTSLFLFPSSKLSGLSGFSAVLVMFPQFKSFFYKRHIVWNKVGGNIKINTKSKHFLFSDIENVVFENEKLVLNRKNKSQMIFSLSNIHADDISKLKEIFNNKQLK